MEVLGHKMRVSGQKVEIMDKSKKQLGQKIKSFGGMLIGFDCLILFEQECQGWIKIIQMRDGFRQARFMAMNVEMDITQVGFYC